MTYILLDVEGVTTDIKFVHNTLFPYARQHLPGYVQRELAAGNRFVEKQAQEIVRISEEKDGINVDLSNVPDVILDWITKDRKDPPLKELQGLVWEHGYKSRDFKGHIYDDAYEQIVDWYGQGVPIGIFSSGSVGAQKLLFAFSDHGDISHFFSHHFSSSEGVLRASGLYTPIAKAIGTKTSEEAYRNITSALGVSAHEIMFYSDSAETPDPAKNELGPARSVGLQTVHVIREGLLESTHPMIRGFGGVFYPETV